MNQLIACCGLDCESCDARIATVRDDNELREKTVNEDWNLWLKLLAKGKKPVRMNFIGFWYRKKFENGELERSKQNRERALSIINKTAKTITQKVRAIQYPKSDYNWQEIVEEMPENVHYKIEENNKINVLMIIPWMITGGADKFNFFSMSESKYFIH